MKQSFKYHNVERKHMDGGKVVRSVTIKNGRGHKSVKYYKNGRLFSNVKKTLKPVEVSLIKVGKFIPGLFGDCPCNKKTRKHRK
jgi:hypothetical protein